jgi:hypothetical protein
LHGQFRPQHFEIYGTFSINLILESAALWKVDAIEAGLGAESGFDRFA